MAAANSWVSSTAVGHGANEPDGVPTGTRRRTRLLSLSIHARRRCARRNVDPMRSIMC